MGGPSFVVQFEFDKAKIEDKRGSKTARNKNKAPEKKFTYS